MPATGKLRTWNEDRGFGFIAPTNGGREVFVHISAFPRDGSRPTVGESLVYELGPSLDGKPQAVRVVRQALGTPASYPSRAGRPQRPPRPRRSLLSPLVVVLLLIVGGSWGYTRYQQQASATREPSQPRINLADLPRENTHPAASTYRCDGRTQCSQMTSCAEATYFLKNCPGTQMDGDHDGVPCEQQWCTGGF